MSIRVGRPAPAFTVEAYVRSASEAVPVSIEEYRGRWVVLFFYPRDFTFICPTEIQAFGELARDFAGEDAVVLGASTDSFYVHKAWYESDARLGCVGFPVLADTSQALSAAYGVLLEDGAAQRATFVIDPQGIVRHVSVTELNVGRSPHETLRVLQALRTGELCPVGWRPGEPTLNGRPTAKAS